MTNDPIVEEIKKVRQEYAAEFNFDLDRIFDDLQARERQSGVPHETRNPKPFEPEHPVAA
jgi:hypothetical protein